MRLIDADPITQRLTYNNGTPTVDNYRDGAPVTLALREIKDLIQNAPTVSPWVKTSDRLPTEADGVVVAWGNIEIPEINDYGYAFAIREMFLNPLYKLPYWMPIPPLPDAGDMAPNGEEGARE